MSWQDDAMIEQERADALKYMGEAEWRETNVDDISYMYANPDVTKAFKMLDGEKVDDVEQV